MKAFQIRCAVSRDDRLGVRPFMEMLKGSHRLLISVVSVDDADARASRGVVITKADARKLHAKLGAWLKAQGSKK